MNMKNYYSLLCISVCSIGLLNAIYVKYQLKKPVAPRRSVTYVADDGQYEVTLDVEDLRLIEFILKPHVTSDEDYNKRIDKGFIRRMVDTCRCGEDAVMLEKVLNDFEGKTVRQLFTKLALKGEL